MVLARFAGIRPAAVVRCAGPAEVAAAIAEAQDKGLSLAVRGGGHCFAGRSSTDGLLIDLGPMTGVRTDGDRAVIGGGTLLAEVYDTLAAHGRTLAAGCGPTVGVAGLTLGGGLGILGRRHGLTCDSLVAATMVRADGQVVEADDDLLWLLRGGGAPGVVTSLTFRTVPAPDSTAFRLTFPADAAATVLDAWQHLLPELDEAVAPSLVITAPPDPDRPLTVAVFGAAPDHAAVDALIRRLGVTATTGGTEHIGRPSAGSPARTPSTTTSPIRGRSISAGPSHRPACSPACSPTGARARNASSTSHRGAAPTTVCPPPPRLFPTVTPSSCSSRPPRSPRTITQAGGWTTRTS
ncbi:FAD-binding oxidoreductase [Actinoplanes sp. CA-131856]